MVDTVITELLRASPVVAFMAAFAWALLAIVRQVVRHYEDVLDGCLANILSKLSDIAIIMQKCQK